MWHRIVKIAQLCHDLQQVIIVKIWDLRFSAAKVLVLWVVTLCKLVGKCQCFGGTYCLHLPLTCQYLPTSLQSVRTKRTNTDIFTTVRTSKLIYVHCNRWRWRKYVPVKHWLDLCPHSITTQKTNSEKFKYIQNEWKHLHFSLSSALYLWLLQFLQCEEASTGVRSESLLRVCHQAETWMHRQPVFAIVISRNKHNNGNLCLAQAIVVFLCPSRQITTTTSSLSVFNCHTINTFLNIPQQLTQWYLNIPQKIKSKMQQKS
jgi:hypothetical protein